MTEHAEAAGRVAKACRDFVRRPTLEEIRAQGLVLAVDGVLGFQEDALEVG